MVHSLRWTGRCLSLLTLGLMAACGPDQGYDASAGGESTVARIEGNVIYRERMMLPPGAQVEVQLQDISRADALASVLATVMLTPEDGPPYPFAIEYDPARVDPRKRYALRATIAVDGRMLFSSNEYIDPFSGGGRPGNPAAGAPLEVLVQRVPEAVNSDQNP